MGQVQERVVKEKGTALLSLVVRWGRDTLSVTEDATIRIQPILETADLSRWGFSLPVITKFRCSLHLLLCFSWLFEVFESIKCS